MNRKILSVVFLFLTVAWMALIFLFSAQTGEESGGLSAILTEPLTDLLAKLTGRKASNLYPQVDHAVRTAAHFCEYAVLGGLMALLFRCVRIRSVWLPWLAGTAYAVTDEWHQAYSPGRVCDTVDVVIDAMGLLCGILICKLLIDFWRKKHVHHS